jgi:probable HAF family extracellular repeat protein
MKCKMIFLILVMAALLQTSVLAQSYTAVDLGSLHGGSARIHDLNNAGQTVGASGHPHGADTHAFFWEQAGGIRDLGTPFGGDYSVAFSINDSGVVVGSSNSQQGMLAFQWTNGKGFKDLGALPGQNSSIAYDINGAGMIAGASGSHAVLWNGGAIQDLGTLGGQTSEAHGINSAGQIVGVSDSAEGQRAFLWSNGVMKNLGALPGDSSSHADHINDQGMVVGASEGNEGTRAFIWSSESGIEPLTEAQGSTYSEAFGINNQGQIVGQFGSALGVRAFLWSKNSQMVDLNNIVTGLPPGVVLIGAFAINDKGQIVAFGLVHPSIDKNQEVQLDSHAHAGPTHVFLLTPAAGN